MNCPHCNEEWDLDFLCLDVLISADGTRSMDWQACCEAIHWDAQDNGFEAATGITDELLRNVASAITGEDTREVYSEDTEDYAADYVLRYALSEYAPGLGIKGWQGDVFDDIDDHHSHHNRPQGWKFGVAVYNGSKRVGVAVVGRPVARLLQAAEPNTLEVTRVCVWGDTRLRRNASSKLYAICAAEAKKIGATKLITYTLESEEAASLRASNWTATKRSKGGSHSRPSRPRTDKAPTCPKLRWERGLDKRTRREVETRALV